MNKYPKDVYKDFPRKKIVWEINNTSILKLKSPLCSVKLAIILMILKYRISFLFRKEKAMSFYEWADEIYERRKVSFFYQLKKKSLCGIFFLKRIISSDDLFTFYIYIHGLS